jgi:hypothetical protein
MIELVVVAAAVLLVPSPHVVFEAQIVFLIVV